jgi:hypothetical protein
MSNDATTAGRWTLFVASRSYVPKGERILAHFRRGTITRICDCGCNSYDLTVPAAPDLETLMSPGRAGAILQLGYYIRGYGDPMATVEITVFVNDEGYLSGIDVDFCGNSSPMPESVELSELPFHIYGALADPSVE